MTSGEKTYIGDGVFASYDGYHVVLEVDTGSRRIFLPPDVWSSLEAFVAGLRTSKVEVDPDEV